MSGKAQQAALEALVEAHTAELHLPTVRRAASGRSPPRR